MGRTHGGPGMISGPACPSVPNDRETQTHYGTVASFNILMQNFYKLQQVRMERVSAFITHLEGVLNAVQ